MKVLNVYGPPGSGKTSRLTLMVIKAARLAGGPSKIAAVTYTRAAAQELKLRVAESLGLSTDPKSLARELPWIGTIHCSPPDEQVLTTTRGWIPIANLSDADRLASYMTTQNRVVRGAYQGRHSVGYPFEVASRPYSGDLLTLSTADSTTRVTPNHRVRARFSLEAQEKFVVYLMRRGSWWRIGRTKTFSVPFRSGGIPGRLATEKADAAWVLGYYDTMNEAAYQEARISALYGIPELTFEITSTGRALTSEDVWRVHEEASTVVTARALRLLDDWGMSVELPLFEPRRLRAGEPLVRYGYWFNTAACNLVPGFMELPVVEGESREVPRWLPLSISREHYEGPVYSLDVPPYHHYVSGGAVVHNSLSYHLSGRPKLASPEAAYAALSGKSYRESTGNLLDQGMLPYDGDLDEPALALRLESSARHRLVHPFDALKTLPLEALARTTPQRLFELIRTYRAWKNEQRLADYEDLLELGRQHAPPVKALFCDESQDNSRLLWSVLDSWQSGTDLVVYTGDPWQACYQFSGADPQGFRDRPGGWVSLGKSYRLTQPSVDYATRILKRAGWADPLIDTWVGHGRGEETDGSEFVLARTHRLVSDYEKTLVEQGVPFRRLNGKSPLEQDSLPAWRALGRLRDGETIPAYQLEPLKKYVTKIAGGGAAFGLSVLIRDADAPVDPEQFHKALGVPASEIRYRIPWASYYNRVERARGTQALIDPPKIALGTVHSAKGLEADRVTVLRQWGVIPSKSLQDPAPAKDEACVAFVSGTRHRVSLRVIDGLLPGPTYPFSDQS